MQLLGPDYMFMDDNAPCHHARVVMQWMQHKNTRQKCNALMASGSKPAHAFTAFAELPSLRSTTYHSIATFHTLCTVSWANDLLANTVAS